MSEIADGVEMTEIVTCCWVRGSGIVVVQPSTHSKCL